MRLERKFRVTLYGVFAVLFASGAGWFVADRLKDGDSGELWQQVSANLLMAHGGTAMLALLCLGALGPLHVKRGWRGRTNRMTGSAVVTINAVLIATAFGLYYLGSDAVRPWISTVHLAFGLGLPAILLAHVVTGRRWRR
ncbi:MAG: hypothetical protein AB1586_30170 [Pseudomonadota bacterium]|jgi:hypothetical protein